MEKERAPIPPNGQKKERPRIRARQSTDMSGWLAQIEQMPNGSFKDALLATYHNNTESVRLSCLPLRSEGIVLLCAAIKQNHSLIALDISNVNLTDLGNDLRGLEALCDSIKTTKTLRALNIACNSIYKDGAIKLGDALMVNRSIERLDLSRNSLRAEGARTFADVLNYNRTLTDLNLCQNNLTNFGDEDNGVSSLFDALKFNRSLSRLNLKMNRISSMIGDALNEALTDNISLTVLDLSENPLGPDGVSELCSGISSNRNIILRELYLSSSQVQNRGAIAIAEVLKTNASIVYIDLRMNYIGDQGAEALAEALNLPQESKDSQSHRELVLKLQDNAESLLEVAEMVFAHLPDGIVFEWGNTVVHTNHEHVENEEENEELKSFEE